MEITWIIWKMYYVIYLSVNSFYNEKLEMIISGKIITVNDVNYYLYDRDE